MNVKTNDNLQQINAGLQTAAATTTSRRERWITAYVDFVFRFRFLIIVVWVALSGSCAYLLPKFLQNTSQNFDPSEAFDFGSFLQSG